MKIFLNIVGILLALFGIVWFLQGMNLMPGTPMSGQLIWVVIGVAVFIAGAGILFFGNKGKKKTA